MKKWGIAANYIEKHYNNERLSLSLNGIKGRAIRVLFEGKTINVLADIGVLGKVLDQ